MSSEHTPCLRLLPKQNLSTAVFVTAKKAVNFLCTRRPVGCMSDSVPTLGLRRGGFVYWVCNCAFEARLFHTASRRDRQTAQHKQHVHYKNCRGGGVELLNLSSCNAFAATDFLRRFEPERPTRRLVGFVGGAIGCSGLRPIVHERLCPDRPNADVFPDFPFPAFLQIKAGMKKRQGSKPKTQGRKQIPVVLSVFLACLPQIPAFCVFEGVF